MSEIKIREAVPVAIELIHPNDWNPNEQSEETFNKLQEEILEDGFDEPIQVVPCKCDQIKDPHFKLIGGEHRWKICRLHGVEKIPAVIYEEWNEDVQKFKTVKKNLLKGDLNPVKFTRLVKEMEKTYPKETLYDMFGFSDDKEFQKFIVKDKDKADRALIDDILSSSRVEKVATDSITDIVATIFAHCGETIDQNFLFFTHKGKTHMALIMDKEQMKTIEMMNKKLRDSGDSASDFVVDALKDKLSKAS